MTHHHLPARSFLCSLESRGGEKGENKIVRNKQTDPALTQSFPTHALPTPPPVLHYCHCLGQLPSLSRQHQALAPKPPLTIGAGLLEPASWGGVPYPWASNATSTRREQEKNNSSRVADVGISAMRGRPQEVAWPPSHASGDPHTVRGWVLAAAKDQVQSRQHDWHCHTQTH